MKEEHVILVSKRPFLMFPTRRNRLVKKKSIKPYAVINGEIKFLRTHGMHYNICDKGLIHFWAWYY